MREPVKRLTWGNAGSYSRVFTVLFFFPSAFSSVRQQNTGCCVIGMAVMWG